MNPIPGALFRADSWNFPGLKDGQILRTISNITCTDSHYASDDDKIVNEATRRRQSLHDSAAPSVTAEEVPLSLAGSSLPSTQTTCTVSLPSSSRPSGAQKDSMSPRKLALPFGGKRRPLQAVPTFDLVASAGAPATKDPLQHFPLPERSGLFADMLGSLEVNSEGDTASPKLMAVQLHNLGHLFDDLDKTGSEASVCPETPLHFFPNTPTSERLLHSQLGQMLPETQTPPQTTPAPSMHHSSRYGSGCQQQSYESGLQQSTMSPLTSDARAHSVPSPPAAVQGSAHRHESSRMQMMQHRAYSSPLPPLLEPCSFPARIRTGRPNASLPSSPARPSGLRKVQGGQQQRAKVTGRRMLAMALSFGSDVKRAASLKSEDPASGGNTDSEGDSLATDGGSSKCKQGGRKGSGRKARRMSCRNCATHQTPQWRCGPEGPRTLCNACGVRYKKGIPLNGWPGRASLGPSASESPQQKSMVG